MKGSKKVVVAILVDALGWEVVEHYGFCRDVLGRARPMDTILGYSSAAIPSVLTGKLPCEHGSWLMYRYDPLNSPFRYLKFLPPLPKRVERRLKAYVKRLIDRRGIVKGYYDLYDVPLRYLRYFDISGKRDSYSPAMGPEGSIFEEVSRRNVPLRIWDYRAPEEINFRELLSSLNGRYRFLFLYTANLDALMHREGLYNDSVEEKLAQYEKLLIEILDRARGGAVRLYVFSDHGMTPVERTLDVWGSVERAGMSLDDGWMAFYDATMARFWPGHRDKQRLLNVLHSLDGGRLLEEGELGALGCRFEDRSYGEVLFLADPGVMIVPSFMSTEKLAAMHGYHPSDRYSRACFLTNDPDCELPGHITDVKRVLLQALDGV